MNTPLATSPAMKIDRNGRYHDTRGRFVSRFAVDLATGAAFDALAAAFASPPIDDQPIDFAMLDQISAPVNLEGARRRARARAGYHRRKSSNFAPQR